MKRRDERKTRYYVTICDERMLEWLPTGLEAPWSVGPFFQWNNALRFAKANLEHYKEKVTIDVVGKTHGGKTFIKCLSADVFSMFKPYRFHNRRDWTVENPPACHG